MFSYVRLLLLSAALAGLADSAAAQNPLRGVALVIGNGKYEHVQALPNPANDADAIERLLSDLGFESTRRVDRKSRELSRDLDRFAEDARDADVAILYYSGHGIEAGGENYLVPVDADISALDSAANGLVPLSAYIDRLKATVPVVIVMLDACRNNPFPPGATLRPSADAAPMAIGGAGLVQTRGAVALRKPAEAAPEDDSLGTVVAFAAEPGKAALDGDAGGNSPYAAAILRHLDAMAGEEFGTVMRMVAEEVYLKTRGQQRPWMNESLRRLLYFGQPSADPSGDEGDILKERRKLLLTIDDLPDATRRDVETAAARADIPMDALYGMVQALGADMPGDPKELERLLNIQTERLRTIIAEQAALSSADPEIARLSGLAEKALAEGALDTNLRFRTAAKERFSTLAETLDKSEAELKARRLEGGAVFARLAEAYSLKSEHDPAIENFRKAFDQVERWDKSIAFRYKMQEAEEILSTQADDRYDSVIPLYREANKLVARQADPLDWAEVHHAFGNAIWQTGHVQQAFQYLKDAADERTRERDERAWAESQMSLADWYLWHERRSSESDLQEALSRYRQVLTYHTFDRDPADWSTVQERIGDALNEHAAETGKMEDLEAAVASYEAILTIPAEIGERYPWIPASAAERIGQASWLLYNAVPEDRKTYWLQKAVASLEQSTAFPVSSGGENRLGFAMTLLGERTNDPSLFDRAIPILREGLAWREMMDRVLEDRSQDIRDSLCRALMDRGIAQGRRDDLIEAKALCEKAIIGMRAANEDSSETEGHVAKIESALAASGP